jgi:Protein of unknown function (DUF2510)
LNVEMNPPEDRRPGWYPDPTRRFQHRYYNGVQWTADVAVDGELSFDRPGPQLVGLSQQSWTPRPAPRSRGAAITSLVLSICALVLGWIPFIAFLAAVALVLAVIFGFLGIRRAAVQGGHGRGMAVAGLTICAPAALACALGIVLSVSLWRALQEWTNPEPVEVITGDCAIEDGRLSFEGRVTNLDTRMRSYTLRILLDDGESRQIQVIHVDDVLAKQTEEWEISMAAEGTTPLCTVTRINGPEPWGIEMD